MLAVSQYAVCSQHPSIQIVHSQHRPQALFANLVACGWEADGYSDLTHNPSSQISALQIRAGAGAAERSDQRSALAAGADAGHAQARWQERKQVTPCKFCPLRPS